MKKENSQTKLQNEIYAKQQDFTFEMEKKMEERKGEFCKSHPTWVSDFAKIHAEEFMWDKEVTNRDFQILDKPSKFIEAHYSYRNTKSRFYNNSVEVEPYCDYEGCYYQCSVYLKSADMEAFKKEQKKTIRYMKKINALLDKLHNSTEYKKYSEDVKLLEKEMYNGKESIREKMEKEYNRLYSIDHDCDDYTKKEFMEELKKHFPDFYIERESHYRSDMVRYLFHKRTGETTHARAVAFTFKATENCDTHYSNEYLKKITKQIESEMNDCNSPANIVEKMKAKYPTLYFHQKKTEVTAYMGVDEHHYNSNYGRIATFSYKNLDEKIFDSKISEGMERVKKNVKKYLKMNNLTGYDLIRQKVYKQFAKFNDWNF